MTYDDIAVPFRGWTVVCELGNGNYGKVYEICRDQYGIVERSAMKVISVPQNPNEIHAYLRDGYAPETLRKMYDGSRASVLREYQTMVRLKDCPNIVRCEDIEIVMDPDDIGSKIYIRMELLTPIREYKKLRSFDEGEVIKLGSDICNMLMRCETEGIVHRDIKPGNIMVSSQGDYKLGDFGIARSMDHTTFATRVGTMNYMAPEVFLGRKYGHTADIYSLGLVLYWLLNNKRMPFFPQNDSEINNDSANAAQEQRMIGTPIPQPVNGGAGLSKVVLKALAYDPGDRYQSALEFGNEIRNCLSAERASERQPIFGNEITESSYACENENTEEYSQNTADVYAETEPLNKDNDRQRRYEAEMILRREADRRFKDIEKETLDSKEENLWANETSIAADTEERGTKRPALKKRYLGGIVLGACVLLGLVCTFSFMNHVKNNRHLPDSESNGQESAVVSTGDVYIFGSYEQDDDFDDGTEPIEWIVLDESDDGSELLLISKYALDAEPFNTEDSDDVSWENCSLRSWLNMYFYNTAFSDEEKNRIKETTAKIEVRPTFTEPGADTLDKVFLLNGKEADNYFKDNIARKCICTSYAQSRYAGRPGNCDWWLRTRGVYTNTGIVNENGEIVYISTCSSKAVAVRPALWVSIAE